MLQPLEQHADDDCGRHEQEMADTPADIDVLMIADVDEEVEEHRRDGQRAEDAEAARSLGRNAGIASAADEQHGPATEQRGPREIGGAATRLTASSTTAPLRST